MFHCELCGSKLNDPWPKCPKCGRYNSTHVVFWMGGLWFIMEVFIRLTFGGTTFGIFIPQATLVLMISYMVTVFGAIVHQVRIEKSVDQGLYEKKQIINPVLNVEPMIIEGDDVANKWLTSLHEQIILIRTLRFGEFLADFLVYIETSESKKTVQKQPANNVIAIGVMTTITLGMGATWLNWLYTDSSFWGFLVAGFYTVLILFIAFIIDTLAIFKKTGIEEDDVQSNESVSLTDHQQIKIKNIREDHQFRAHQCDHAIKEFNRLVLRTEVSVRNLLLSGKCEMKEEFRRVLTHLQERRVLIVRLCETFSSILEGETRGIYIDNTETTLAESLIKVDSAIDSVEDYIEESLEDAEVQIRSLLRTMEEL